MAEETVLLKAFKYYDLNDKGTCDPKEFMRALIKIGINFITDENVGQIFALYDHEEKGYINYKDFVEELFREPNEEEEADEKEKVESPKKAKKGLQKNYIASIMENKEIFDNLYDDIKNLGETAIFDLLKAFIDEDKEKTFKCSKDSFINIIKKFNFNVTSNEVDKILQTFEEDKLPYIPFILAIAGKLDNFRGALVEQAFRQINPSSKNEIELAKIYESVFVDNHPKVLEGKCKSNEILDDFKDCFDMFHYAYTNGKSEEPVTLGEFIDFYECVSMDYDDDSLFEKVINNFYKIKPFLFKNEKIEWSKEDKEYDAIMNENTFNEEIDKETRSKIIEKFKNILKRKGAKGIVGLLKSFKRLDENNSFNLDFDEYSQVMNEFLKKEGEDLSSEFTQEDIELLFDVFDFGHRGFMNYKKLLHFAHGGLMNPIRKKIVETAFRKLDVENKDEILARDLRSMYSAPTPNIIPDLLDALEVYHNTVRGSRRPTYVKAEFIGFYNLISFLFPSDDSFNKYICSTWNVNEDDLKKKEVVKDASDLGKQKRRVEDPGKTKKVPFGTIEGKINYQTSSDPKFSRKNKNKSDFEDFLEDIRKKTRARGIRGIMGVRRAFFMGDENDSKTIDLNEFGKLLDKYRFNLPQNEKECLFKKFDKDNSGQINYNEFIDTLIGELNDFRMKIVKRVFEKLDAENKGYVTLNQLRFGFNPNENPKVRARIKEPEVVLGDYIDLIEYHFKLLQDNEDLPVDGTGDIIVDTDEFVDFFRNISSIYEEDKDFEIAISAEFGLDLNGLYPYQKGWKGYEQ